MLVSWHCCLRRAAASEPPTDDGNTDGALVESRGGDAADAVRQSEPCLSPRQPQLHLPWMIISMGCGGSRADAIIEPRYHESWTRETESTWLTNTDVETPLPVANSKSLRYL